MEKMLWFLDPRRQPPSLKLAPPLKLQRHADGGQGTTDLQNLRFERVNLCPLAFLNDESLLGIKLNFIEEFLHCGVVGSGNSVLLQN